jgi:hypothetical protein
MTLNKSLDLKNTEGFYRLLNVFPTVGFRVLDILHNFFGHIGATDGFI